MTARISAAESIPTPSGGPEKSGNFFSHAGVISSSFRTIGTSTKIPHSPYTIEGIAASSSVRNASGVRSGRGESSERKTAMPSAIGVEISIARIEE